MPLHAGASTDVETTRYSALRGILLVVVLVCFAFYPYHSRPVASWANSDTFRFVPSVVSPDAARRKESPQCVCPADRCLFRLAVVLFILLIPIGSIPAIPPVPFYRSYCPCLRHPRRHRLGFIRCESTLSRLIRRLEVHFLKILPSCEA